MSKYNMLQDMADDILETGDIYIWQEKDGIVWTFAAVGEATITFQ